MDEGGAGGEHAAARAALVGFREAFYGCLSRWGDALFELADAALCVGAPVGSVPALSLEPVFRRGHGSLYKALANGGIDAEALRQALVAHRLAGWPSVFAVDASSWPRCDAETSPERGFYYSAAKHSADQPIVAGWSYQWIAGLSWAADSWTVPLDARRIPPRADTLAATLAQLGELVGRLGDAGPVPLFVFDAGYDPIALGAGLAEARAQVLVRIRSDRLFYPDPAPAPAGTLGRPRRHGARFACADPASWPAPDASLSAADPRYGTVEVQAWHGLHPKLHGRGRWAGAFPPIVRDGHPGRGRAPPETHRPRRQDPLAVVVRTGTARPRRLLAGVPAPLRPRAHLPLHQGGSRLDRARAAYARAGRPLDLARGRGLHPAPPRPGPRRRRPAALGTPL